MEGLEVPKNAKAPLVFATLALAVAGTVVVVPRPTYPHVLPLPTIDQAVLQRTEEEERHRASSVVDGSLSKAVRAVGERVRRLGEASYDKLPLPEHLLKNLRRDAKRLVARGHTESLVNLRALQSELFVKSLKKWEAARLTGARSNLKTPNPDLKQLGGSFARTALSSWMNDDGLVLLSSDELRLLFRLRWGKLTGLAKEPAFAASLEEYRRYYSFHLLHPLGGGSNPAARASAQLPIAVALARLDPNYPGELAVGMLELSRGHGKRAALFLQKHLKRNENGPWANIARNHLALARLLQTRSLDTPR